MQMVEFSGTYRGQTYAHQKARLVKGPFDGAKGVQITVDGTGNDALPQQTFRVVLNSPTSFNILRGEEARMPSEPTDEELDAKIKRRFKALDVMSQATINGYNNALIVSGPAGLGKSYSIEGALKEANVLHDTRYDTVKGFVRATGVYKMLYQFRQPGNVLVFDDADSVLLDDISLNLLKAALDTTEERWISWRSEGKMESDDGELLPNTFLFEGQVIFITNLDFEGMIERGSKIAPHLEALLSRSHYLDIDIRTPREYIVRIKQVCKHGMLRKKGLSATQEAEVIAYMEENAGRLRELSLRMALKLATMLKMDHNNWRELAEVTVLKRAR